MNTDYRITTDALDHPKLVKLKRLTGDAGIICLFRLWGFTARYHPRGDLNEMTQEDIEIAVKWEGEPGQWIQAALRLRLLDECLGQYSVHDWEEHNGYAFHAPERKQRAKNAANVRWGCVQDASSNAKSSAVSIASCNAPSPTPNPTPNPSPSPSPNPSTADAVKPSQKKSAKETADSRKVSDCYQKHYVERFDEKPAWGKQEGKRIRELLERYPADKVLRAIEIIFTVKDELITPHIGVFRSCMSDKFVDRALTLKVPEKKKSNGTFVIECLYDTEDMKAGETYEVESWRGDILIKSGTATLIRKGEMKP